MNTKSKNPVPQQFELPDLPGIPDLPDLPELGNLPDLDIDAIMNPPPTILDERNGDRYGENIEENSALDDAVIVDEFQSIRDGRKKQAESIELANDTEYWYAMYFQSREQKEAFLKAMKWFEHGDKYIDGRWAAKKLGIELPARPAPYKVGAIDKKLKDLT